MKVRQSLSLASKARNPFVCAFGYLRRVIRISNQFSDERGGLVMLCEVYNTT